MQMFSKLLVLVPAVAATSGELAFREKENVFDEFKSKFSKTYKDAAEELMRFKVFMNNMEHAEKMMTNDPTAEYSVMSPFADMTQEEFYTRNGFSASVADFIEHQKNAETMPLADVPTSYDARDKGLVTPVKNQGQCGSCWAFATVANIEGQNKQVNGQLVSLSEQELVDCSKSDHGCQGGLPTLACKDLIDNKQGLETEEAYSYKAVSEKCNAELSLEKVFLSSYKSIATDETQIAMALMQYGPLAIGINAQYMQLYTGGISDPFWCPAQLDHGVTIVAFGEATVKKGLHWPWAPASETKKFWTIKNSWGTTWGEKGYYRIVRGSGKCGLNKMVSTAIVAPKAAAQQQQVFV